MKNMQTCLKSLTHVFINSLNRFILVLFLLPLLTFSQSEGFTSEQEALVQEVVDKIENNEIDYQQSIKTINEALDKAPNHPDLVYQLFRMYMYGKTNSKFVSDYCKNLGREYLQNNQEILVEFCAGCTTVEKEFDFSYSLISLINSQKHKDLYYGSYYLETEEYAKAEKFILPALKNEYSTRTASFFKGHLFESLIEHFVSINDINKAYDFIKTNNDALVASKLQIAVYFFLLETAIIKEDFKLGEDLIRYTTLNYPQHFNLIFPAKAYLYSSKGNDDLGKIFLESALTIDDSAFEIILNETGGLNIFPFYLNALNNLSDYDTKIYLMAKMLDFFKEKKIFTLRTKLYQSILLAAEDIEKAKAILNSCKTDISTGDYDSFCTLIQIENELHKNEPDYRLVDQIIEKLKPDMTDEDYVRLKFDFKTEVNAREKFFYFEPREMNDVLNKLIVFIDDEEAKQDFIFLSIKTIALYDIDSAYEELNKLGLEGSQKLLFQESLEKTLAIDTNEAPKKYIKGINGFKTLKSTLIDLILSSKVVNN